MSLRDENLEKLHKKIIHHFEIETNANLPWIRRKFSRSLRWALMLFGEYVRDDVKVRAESLAFLMIFSLLPLIAGCFFIFTIFTQFGMVQEAIGSAVSSVMATLPEEHAQVLLEYTLKFKEGYLNSIESKSGTLGIFSLLILGWVGLQTFSNIDRTLNFIWSSDQERPFLEKVRNFIVASVVAPIVLTASLSVPLILQKIPATRELLFQIPLLMKLLNSLIPLALILATFTSLYKLVPVSRVRWSSALVGGVFAATLLQLSNIGLQYYFKFGTHTAYGKAAILPLLGFWIFVVWIIVILGAEVSYLFQNEKHILASHKSSPTISETQGLLSTVAFFQEAHDQARNPIGLDELFSRTGLSQKSIKNILRFLETEGIVVETATRNEESTLHYVLARSLRAQLLSELLSKYLERSGLGPKAEKGSDTVDSLFEKNLTAWINSFSDKRVSDLL